MNSGPALPVGPQASQPRLPRMHMSRTWSWRGELLPIKRQTFEAYVRDWWIWERCPYIRSRLARGGKISRLYADSQRQRLVKYLLPKFGKKSKKKKRKEREKEEPPTGLSKKLSLEHKYFEHSVKIFQSFSWRIFQRFYENISEVGL